ncbi:MFS general substrate transporter [Patellaria atrata CBS 101060]|uniref:MFS general substrate transporter n=1 Tax=Patellaria atrata CBS 101060 TaxID=1346257 RepID=A0A9P4SHS2_9PEZI|nr:MFS general substrate transporter [Patellaria atrata CBS 101060]
MTTYPLTRRLAESGNPTETDNPTYPQKPSPTLKHTDAKSLSIRSVRSTVHNTVPSTPPYCPGNPKGGTNTTDSKTSSLRSAWSIVYNVLSWTPPNCRWDPKDPPQFSMSLNVLFAFAGAFTVANLYYNHPILNILAYDFDVPYEKVAQIPTVMQAGYAAGLLFLCPLGDLFKRRPFTLFLVFFTSTMWIGLCITKSLAVFTAISFITAITTVTPQLMLPLVGDLAPPHRRATALSIVVSGLMLGILLARILSGTLTNYTTWRSIYWTSLGLQYLIFLLLWLHMPDYPSTNPSGLSYLHILRSIPVMLTTHPVLVQACLIALLTSATFTSFWTTLTFLLSGSPYHYTPLVIGLFGLIGIASMLLNPLYARLVTDAHVPLFSVLVGVSACLLGIVIGTYTGPFTVAGPVFQALLADFGIQTAQIANRSAIYAIEPRARNRVNTAFMLATFCGQLVGTAVGNRVYAVKGWVGSGSVSVGFVGAAGVVCLARGPWEEGWCGWRGGWGMRKREVGSADGRTVEGRRLGERVVEDAGMRQERGEVVEGVDVEKHGGVGQVGDLEKFHT